MGISSLGLAAWVTSEHEEARAADRARRKDGRHTIGPVKKDKWPKKNTVTWAIRFLKENEHAPFYGTKGMEGWVMSWCLKKIGDI